MTHHSLPPLCAHALKPDFTTDDFDVAYSLTFIRVATDSENENDSDNEKVAHDLNVARKRGDRRLFKSMACVFVVAAGTCLSKIYVQPFIYSLTLAAVLVLFVSYSLYDIVWCGDVLYARVCAHLPFSRSCDARCTRGAVQRCSLHVEASRRRRRKLLP